MRTTSNCWKRKDGRWESRICLGKAENGKYIYQSVYGHSYKEVSLKREQFLYEKIQNEERSIRLCKNEKIYFNDAMAAWLDTKKNEIKYATYVDYMFILEDYVYPYFMNKVLDQINCDLINDFLRKLLSEGRICGEGGLSAKTVSDIKVILVQGLKYIEKKYEISVDIEDIFSPRVEKPIIHIMAANDQRQLEDFLFKNGSGVSLGVVLSLYCGLRIGEICALTWNDIDLINHRIHVNKSLNRVKNPDKDSVQKTLIEITTPKTSSSCREVPIPDSIYEYIYKLSCKGKCYVLTSKTNYMEPRLLEYRYKKILRKNQIMDYTFHTLRHTFATRCVTAGVDIKTLSEILGHSSVQITLQRYVHPTIEQKHDQINKLQMI